MSAQHRTIARLPLKIFTDLITRELDRPLNPEQLRTEICAKLKKARVKVRGGNTTESINNVGDLLKLSTISIMKFLDPILIYEECSDFINRICNHCTPTPRTVFSMLHETGLNTNLADGANGGRNAVAVSNSPSCFLPTGLESLDRSLKGGVQIGTITEIVGRAGSGKTQLALQLCTMAAKFNYGSIYIDTEKKVSLPRLQEIGSNRSMSDITSNGHRRDRSLASNVPDNAFIYKSPDTILNNLTLRSPTTTEELVALLQITEEEILVRNQEAETKPNKYPVRLLIVDSIAAPARRDFGSDSAPQRAAAVFRCAQLLKHLADQFQLAVIAINQVGLDINSNADTARQGTNSDVSVRAALGTSWHHCVSSRILLEHDHDPHRLQEQHDVPADGNGSDELMNRLRHLTILKSNVCKRTTMPFELSAMGLIEHTTSSINSST